MKRRAAWLGLVSSVVAGCSVGPTYNPYYWDYPYYDSYYYGYDAFLVTTWTDSAGATVPTRSQAIIDLEATAAAIASRADTDFQPTSCATATASGPTVSYVFTNCLGQYGVRMFSGKAILMLAANDGGLTLTARSSELVADDRPYVVDFSAAPTKNGSQRSASITSRSHLLDQVDARQGQATVTWDEGGSCVEVDGTDTSSRGGRSASSTLAGFRRCVSQCPTAGTITVNSSEGVFVASYDGAPDVEVTAPNGARQSYDLQCE